MPYGNPPTQIWTLKADPEMSTLDYYMGDEDKCAKEAMSWNDQVAQIFKSRQATHSWGVFTNWFDGTRQ